MTTSRKNHTVAIVLAVVGGVGLLVILVPIALFLMTGWVQSSTLKKESRSLETYSLFSSWGGSGEHAIPNINVLCLDRCSDIHGSFTSKASDLSASNIDITKDFLQKRGYNDINADSDCGQESVRGTCTLHAHKGSLKLSITLPRSSGYTSFTISY